MEARRDVFQAIADPTRRAIIGMVAKEAVPITTIASQFDVSRQAISLHLKILEECGLLQIKQQGRERICKAQLGQLNEVNDWLRQYKQFWTKKLDDLDHYLNSISHSKSTKHGRSRKKNRR